MDEDDEEQLVLPTPVTALSSEDSLDSNSMVDEEQLVPPQPPSTLVEESDLKVVDGYQGLLVVNKQFSLLICIECGGGMKPKSVFKHFTEPHPVHVPSPAGVPVKLESRTVNHCRKLVSKRKHLEELKKWLLAKGINAASGDNRDKWLKQFPKQDGPRDIVQGLQIRPGLICACGTTNSSSGSF